MNKELLKSILSAIEKAGNTELYNEVSLLINGVEKETPISSVKGYGIDDMRKCWEKSQEAATGTDDFPMGGNTFTYPTFDEYISSLPTIESSVKGEALPSLELAKIISDNNEAERKRSDAIVNSLRGNPSTLSAEEVLTKHVQKMLTSDNSYKSIEEMRELPEWKSTIDAIHEYHNQFSKEALPLQKEDEWISVEERKPEFIEGKDHSENVFAILNGHLAVMCYAYNHSHDDETRGCYWANCYGDINGDPEWDEDYHPTHWMPLPKMENQTINNNYSIHSQ